MVCFFACSRSIRHHNFAIAFISAVVANAERSEMEVARARGADEDSGREGRDCTPWLGCTVAVLALGKTSRPLMMCIAGDMLSGGF